MDQKFLNKLVRKKVSFMLDDVESWCSHRPLLYIALELTKESNKPILELGCGYGSTEQLNKYIENDERKVISFDTNKEWLDKYSHLKNDQHEFVFKPDTLKWNPDAMKWLDTTDEIPNWLHDTSKDGISVCLVDHACGERRHVDIERLYDKCDIIVIHDTQPEATGYMLDKIWHLFKYRINLIMPDGATAVSNKYDLTQLDGLKFKNFVLQK